MSKQFIKILKYFFIIVLFIINLNIIKINAQSTSCSYTIEYYYFQNGTYISQINGTYSGNCSGTYFSGCDSRVFSTTQATYLCPQNTSVPVITNNINNDTKLNYCSTNNVDYEKDTGFLTCEGNDCTGIRSDFVVHYPSSNDGFNLEKNNPLKI